MLEQKQKLRLDELNIESFVTDTSSGTTTRTYKGGYTTFEWGGTGRASGVSWCDCVSDNCYGTEGIYTRRADCQSQAWTCTCPPIPPNHTQNNCTIHGPGCYDTINEPC
jgi:hypothetical protein